MLSVLHKGSQAGWRDLHSEFRAPAAHDSGEWKISIGIYRVFVAQLAKTTLYGRVLMSKGNQTNSIVVE